MTRIHLIFVWLYVSTSLCAQFSFNFDEPQKLDNLAWLGDTDNFVIMEGRLFLAAPEEGSSFIYKKTNLPDSLEIGSSFLMEFSPSNNNKLRIYLHIDTFDLDLASGYFIEIGENGGEDKLKFNRLINGEALTIAEGSPGLFSTEPVDASVKITKSENGFWQCFVRMADSDFYQLELELFDSTIKRYFDQYFGFECIYTSTRKDKFSFDDCYLGSIVLDTTAPKIQGTEVLDEYTLKIIFNEMLEPNTAREKSNYTWLKQNLHPASIGFNDFKPNEVILEFETAFEGNMIHELKTINLQDLEGNRIENAQIVTFYLAEHPLSGDLLINELLFNPYEDGEDFVELYNASSKIIDIQGIQVSNSSKENEFEVIETDLDLFPGEFIVLCPDSTSLEFYKKPAQVSVLEMDIPSFNNDEGNVSLHKFGITIDSFDYNEDMHFQLIDDVEGISLERIASNVESNSIHNWHSASSLSGGATPGYINSQQFELPSKVDTFFWVTERILSPDNDGFQDFLRIQYRLPGEGYVGSVKIFDAFGNYITTVINNQLMGTHGILSWDGLDASISYVPIGPYIILCSLFNANGDIYNQKLLCYLVGER